MTGLMPRDVKRSRYLFDWSARWAIEKNSLDAITGQAATFTRATVGSAIDRGGVLVNHAHSEPRYLWLDLDGDGIRETPHLLLEDARTNLVLQSENFGATWTTGGTPTRTAAAHTASGVSLDLIGDDDAAALEYYQQPVTFTGDAAKAFSIVLRPASSASSVLALADSTSGTNPLLAVITWSGGVPVVTMANGTFLGKEALADGAYRLLFSSTTVTAAHVNIIQVFPATNAALGVGFTGTVYAGGVQTENALFPSSYLKTTTGTVTRNVESCTFAFNGVPQAMTAYVKGVLLSNDASNDPYFIDIGTSGTAPHFFLYSGGAVGQVVTQHHNGTTAVISDANAVGQGVGDTLEAMGVLNADGSVVASGRKNGGTIVTAAATAANALAAAWNGAVLNFNHADSGAGFFAFQSVRIAAGVQSMAYVAEG